MWKLLLEVLVADFLPIFGAMGKLSLKRVKLVQIVVSVKVVEVRLWLRLLG